MAQGYLSLVLHAHLPFVRHPEEEYFLEENWLYEAITETYLPLLMTLEQLVRDGVYFRLTLSLSPTLVSMLRDPFLQERYILHLDRMIELAGREIERTGFDARYHGLALMYHRRFVDFRHMFCETYQRDLVGAFKYFQDTGCLEIMTSCATHGFLPILAVNPRAAEAQIRIGVDSYTEVFGRPPRGIWLPECGFVPGIDTMLKRVGIRYFIVDSHGLMYSDPRPKYGIFAPVYTPAGVAAFGRDWESSKQVWSAKEGYPGDPAYREYYRDIGHELEYEYVRPYIDPAGTRVNTGLKYWRVTGQTAAKEPYRPDIAREKAAEHAADFIARRQSQVRDLHNRMHRDPIIVAPYDAELYGHWWYEGPVFMDFLFRKLAFDQSLIRPATPTEYLTAYRVNQMAMPSSSSWGYKGYSEYWLDKSNDWIYRHIHKAAERMQELAVKFSTEIQNPKDSVTKRALNQAARELLLAESSDWPFIMRTGTMVAYAQRRIRLHISRFTRLYDDLLEKNISEEWLTEIEERDNLFSDMECARYYLPE
ncbi:MAG: glycoside hydrolase family 57 protein [Candidatus Omnitrophota bacterium]